MIKLFMKRNMIFIKSFIIIKKKEHISFIKKPHFTEINYIFAVIMRNLFTKVGFWIQKVIDFFYPPFRKFITPQLFRYGVCGSFNVIFDWVLYFFVYNFILQYRIIDFGFFALSPHIATLIIIFPLVTLVGFLLQKYVTFTASDLRGRVQLFRYLLVVFSNLVINFIGLKILVDGLNFYPTPSKMLITVVTVICSYIGQKKFTFRTSPQKEAKEI